MQHLILTFHKRLCLFQRKIEAYVPASNPIQNKLHVPLVWNKTHDRDESWPTKYKIYFNKYSKNKLCSQIQQVDQ